MASSRTRKTTSVFVDSTVLFAAAYSATGTARDLLREGLRGQRELYISDDVLEETERNLRLKAPEALDQFFVFRESLKARIVKPTKALILEAAQVVAPKDAPIVAAATSARVSYLATWDRKHLLRRKDQLRAVFGIIVATPDDILASRSFP